MERKNPEEKKEELKEELKQKTQDFKSHRKQGREIREKNWEEKERLVQEKLINSNRKLVTAITVIGILFMVALAVWAFKKGLFSDRQLMKEFIQSFGIMAPLAFIGLQIIQCIIPIIPGGVAVVVGVYLFGPVQGFFYNYIGIVLGEIGDFLLARYLGVVFVKSMCKEETYNKYSNWMEKNEGKVKKAFIITMVLPGMPDDIICMLVGLSNMSFHFFFFHLLWTKIPAILGYSLFLNWITKIASYFF